MWVFGFLVDEGVLGFESEDDRGESGKAFGFLCRFLGGYGEVDQVGWSSKTVVGAEVSSQGKGLVTRWTVIVVWVVRWFLEGFGFVRKATAA